jgi:hypothetical protein
MVLRYFKVFIMGWSFQSSEIHIHAITGSVVPKGTAENVYFTERMINKHSLRTYCRVFAGSETNKLVGSGFDTQFIGHSPGGITINYNTFNCTVTITMGNSENFCNYTTSILHRLTSYFLLSS